MNFLIIQMFCCRITAKDSSKIPQVSHDLMQYYESVTKAILGTDEEIMKVRVELKWCLACLPCFSRLVFFMEACTCWILVLLQLALIDLRANTKIASLLPYLVNFVSKWGKNWNTDLFVLYYFLMGTFCLFAVGVGLPGVRLIFWRFQVRMVSHDITQLMKLLHTVQALVSNTSLYLEPKPYVSRCLMTCLLDHQQ